METRITYKTNEEGWKLERDFKEKGYTKPLIVIGISTFRKAKIS